MTPCEVLDFYKSSYRFARLTGMSNANLLNWLKWGYVPIGSQYKLEQLSMGILKAHWDKNGKK